MQLLLEGAVGSLAFILLNSELEGSVWCCPWSQPAVDLAQRFGHVFWFRGEAGWGVVCDGRRQHVCIKVALKPCVQTKRGALQMYVEIA